MKKERPTALDRELANVWRKLEVGEYRVEVRNGVLPQMAFMGLAELKVEGSFRITLGDKRINVVPKEIR